MKEIISSVVKSIMLDQNESAAMEFVKGMREIRKQQEIPKHPLSTEDMAVRMPYALCVALLLMRTGVQMNNRAEGWFFRFCSALDLPEELHARILAEARSAEPLIIHKLFPSLAEPRISAMVVKELKQAIPAVGRKPTSVTIAFIAECQKLARLSKKQLNSGNTAPKSSTRKPAVKKGTASKPSPRRK